MDYKHGLSALPKELMEKLSKIPSWQKFAKKNQDWDHDTLDAMFKDVGKTLDKDEKTLFYRALLQSVAEAATTILEPYVKVAKPLIEAGVTKHANDAFKPGSKQAVEMAKMVIQTNITIIMLCNIYEAQVDNGEMPIDALNDAILDIAEMTGNKDHFKRATTVYETCRNLVNSPELYPKNPAPKKGGNNKFTP